MLLGLLLIHDGLGPLKGRSTTIVDLSERVDRLAHLCWADEAGTDQRRSRQDAEPNLDLVEPRGVGGREMKVDARVT